MANQTFKTRKSYGTVCRYLRIMPISYAKSKETKQDTKTKIFLQYVGIETIIPFLNDSVNNFFNIKI